ncbi:hypothetical protein EVAR_22232_1 [Eumeta japonica]|uniref:C2H2-type domain-containing protein n=1 Tax=Eumeta variegata TaxID=151549 RepID=A0A4C1UBR0_EUMVA|nr:hypothetical protein EVAR_22232_1 [Eumeta japonica]
MILIECSDDNTELEYEIYAKKKDEQIMGTFDSVLESKVCKFCPSLKGNMIFDLKECEHFSTEQGESVHSSEESIADSEDNTEDHFVTIAEEYNNCALNRLHEWDYTYQSKNVIDTNNKEKIILPKSEENEIYGMEKTKKINTKHEFKICDNEIDQYISEPESEQEEYYSVDNSSEEASSCNSVFEAEDDMSKYSAACIISGAESKDMTNLNLSNVVKVECGYVIANKMTLSDYNWHTITINLHEALCAVCEEKFNPASIPRHVQTEKHKMFLDSYPPLDKYGCSITREIGSILHCGVCNKLYSKEDMKTHINEQFHKESLQFAMEAVSSYQKCLAIDNLYVTLIFPKLEVKLPLANWNMTHNAHISFRCLPCKQTYPAVSMMQHFNEKQHCENLSRCRLLSPHQEHTLRVIDTIFHHCGACNVAIYKTQLEEHISSLHHLEALERHSVLIEDAPRWRLFELAALTVFQTVVYINMNTLHCCVCNILLPNLIETLRQHMYSVRHLLFKRKMLNPHAINPTLKGVINKNVVKTEAAGHGYSNSVQTEDKSVVITNEKTVGNVEGKCLNTKTDTNVRTEKHLSSSNMKTISNKETQGEFQNNGPETSLEKVVCQNRDKFVEADMTVEKSKRDGTPEDVQLNSKANLMKKINTEVNQIIEIKKDDATVEGSSERRPSKYHANLEESKIDVANDDKLGNENTEIELIGKRLDDFEGFYSTSETNSQEFVNVKFDETYLKILRVSWDGVINCYEKFHCLVCKVDLFDSTMSHVNGAKHQKNIMKKGFLRKYGENLIRKFDKVHHCAVCDLIVHKSVDKHIDWRTHRENFLLSKDTSRELRNVAEFKTSMIAEAKLILEKFKPLTVHVVDYRLAVKWANWHSILPTKNGFTCILCQSEVEINKLKEHIHKEKHNDYVSFPVKYGINLIRDIDESAVHCVICNKRLTRNGNIDIHINGAKHKKNLGITKIQNKLI